MTTVDHNPDRTLIRTLLAAALLGLCASTSLGQLAVTEVMSSATTTAGGMTVAPNSDWWELTNFGTNTVDLTGYRWNDNQGGLLSADPAPFEGLRIAPGESIVFFQTNAPASGSAAQFREWWGSGLPAGFQAVIFAGNGLSSTGDGIRLWGPDAADESDFVDSVDFGAAVRPSSWVYNPDTGLFDTLSTNGVNGAFTAATSDDIGSPGRTTGPVGVVITSQPVSTSVNPGDTAQFSVEARGLPRPGYQWYFGANPIEGARFATLRVTNVTAELTGPYSVQLNNGFQSIRSTPATLGLNAAPEAPQLVQSPSDASLYVGQGVTLRSMASGVPQPTYQWSFEDRPIEGATEANLVLFAVGLTDAGRYTVTASNRLGTAEATATLVVSERPRLVITEIMPASDTNGPVRGHNDWWELTNLGQDTVNLKGYRFDDGSALLAASVTFTNDIVIKPGESVVLVENMTDVEFRRWWGEGNFRNGVQIITYRGGGLSLSSLGDAINLWNSGASEDFDTVASEVFSTATNGVSFAYDPAAQTFGALSEEGVNGAWRSHENLDVGSPGVIRNPVEPRILNYKSTSGKDTLTWTSVAGRRYLIRSTPGLNTPAWTDVATVQATGARTTHEFTPAAAGGRRFHQVLLLP